jgi:plastocyanin
VIDMRGKRLTWVVLVIAIALSSLAIFAQFDGRTMSPATSSTTGSTKVTSSLHEPTSSSSSSSSSSLPMVMRLGAAYKSLFATPNLMLNYSIVISRYEPTATNVTLSAASTISGVTLRVNPKEFVFQGTQVEVYIGISVALAVNSSILPVEVTASTVDGATSSTFDFALNRALVVILPSGVLTPPTLQVKAGETVTWLNIADNSDANGLANVYLPDGSPPSPTMGLNDVWSRTFSKPGAYAYHITLTQYPNTSGVIVVT